MFLQFEILKKNDERLYFLVHLHHISAKVSAKCTASVYIQAAEEEFVMNVSINHIEIFGILSLVRSFLSETNDYDDLFSFRALTGIALL